MRMHAECRTNASQLSNLSNPLYLMPIAAKQQSKQRMKARSLLVSAVAVCALSSGAVPVSAAAAAVSAVGSSDAASSSSMPVPEVAGDAEATRRVLAQTKEERVSSSPSVGGLLDAFTQRLQFMHCLGHVFVHFFMFTSTNSTHLVPRRLLRCLRSHN